MAALVDVCNMALSRAGTKSTIAALDEQSPEARTCRIHFDVVRDATLRAHPWGFARARADLALVDGQAGGLWRYAYAYPAGCLLMRELEAALPGLRTPYAVGLSADGNSRLVLTDAAPAAAIYTRRVSNAALWDAGFVDAMAWALAADIVMPITGDRAKRADALQAFRMALAGAQLADANEGHDDMTSADPSWIAARA